MSMMLMVKAFGLKVGSASKKLVLLKLADNANDKGECWPSYQHIADQCEMSRRTAMRHVDSLCADGYLVKTSRKGPKGSSTNLYLLTLEGAKVSLAPSDNESPPSDTMSPPSDTMSPPPSDTVSPGISHSFESVIEPVIEPACASGDAPAPDLYSEDFEKFWQAYPSKKGKKPAAVKFRSLRKKNPSPEFLDFLIEDVKCRARGHEWVKENGRYVPMASTYLHQERWNDPAPNVASIQSRHSGFEQRDYSEGLIQGVSDDAANF